jgi:opacity protein-like surface antigen
MKTRTFRPANRPIILATLAFAVSNFSLLAADDELSRKDTTDVYGSGFYINGNHFKGYGGGFGIGYHLSDFVAVNADTAIGRLEARPNGLLYNGLVSVEYDILRRRFTPFLMAEGGVWVEQTLRRSVGSFLVSGTREVTHGAFGAGAGVRWDATDHFFVKAAYHTLEITNGRTEGFAHGLTLGIGYRF